MGIHHENNCTLIKPYANCVEVLYVDCNTPVDFKVAKNYRQRRKGDEEEVNNITKATSSLIFTHQNTAHFANICVTYTESFGYIVQDYTEQMFDHEFDNYRFGVVCLTCKNENLFVFKIPVIPTIRSSWGRAMSRVEIVMTISRRWKLDYHIEFRTEEELRQEASSLYPNTIAYLPESTTPSSSPEEPVTTPEQQVVQQVQTKTKTKTTAYRPNYFTQQSRMYKKNNKKFFYHQ